MREGASQERHTSILCQERTHSSWSGEDTPRSYVRRGQWTRLDPISGEDSGHASTLVKRGYTSILCQERTANTPRSWSGEDTPQSYARRGQRTQVRRGYTSILHVRRGYTSILHCMAMGENNSIPKWLIGLKVRKKEKKQTLASTKTR